MAIHIFLFLFSIHRDQSGTDAIFETLAVIEHSGSMTRDGEGQGHYICDVRCNRTKAWFRTNDNKEAQKISYDKVTENAAVVLYRRKC